MAKDQGMTPSLFGGRQERPPKPIGDLPAKGMTSGPLKKKRFSPLQFYREVQAEGRKITWTTRQETWITSVMVFLMVLLTAAFFVIIDKVLGLSVQYLFNLVG